MDLPHGQGRAVTALARQRVGLSATELYGKYSGSDNSVGRDGRRKESRPPRSAVQGVAQRARDFALRGHDRQLVTRSLWGVVTSKPVVLLRQSTNWPQGRAAVSLMNFDGPTRLTRGYALGWPIQRVVLNDIPIPSNRSRPLVGTAARSCRWPPGESIFKDTTWRKELDARRRLALSHVR